MFADWKPTKTDCMMVRPAALAARLPQLVLLAREVACIGAWRRVFAGDSQVATRI